MLLLLYGYCCRVFKGMTNTVSECANVVKDVVVILDEYTTLIGGLNIGEQARVGRTQARSGKGVVVLLHLFGVPKSIHFRDFLKHGFQADVAGLAVAGFFLFAWVALGIVMKTHAPTFAHNVIRVVDTALKRGAVGVELLKYPAIGVVSGLLGVGLAACMLKASLSSVVRIRVWRPKLS